MMEEDQTIHPNTAISELLENHPETIPVFNAYSMACVGCTMSEYETIATAAENYRLPLEQLLTDLRKAVQKPTA